MGYIYMIYIYIKISMKKRLEQALYKKGCVSSIYIYICYLHILFCKVPVQAFFSYWFLYIYISYIYIPLHLLSGNYKFKLQWNSTKHPKKILKFKRHHRKCYQEIGGIGTLITHQQCVYKLLNFSGKLLGNRSLNWT